MKDNKRIIGAKKLKAVASFLTAMFIILGCTIRPRATETTIDNVEAIIENNEENNEIDHLFALRRDLELEYEKNVSAINNIDLQLAALGVEEITTFELASKMGIDSIPRFSVDSTSTTQ